MLGHRLTGSPWHPAIQPSNIARMGKKTRPWQERPTRRDGTERAVRKRLAAVNPLGLRGDFAVNSPGSLELGAGEGRLMRRIGLGGIGVEGRFGALEQRDQVVSLAGLGRAEL